MAIPNYRKATKAATDAPNLRGAYDEACGNCAYFKYIASGAGMCEKYDFTPATEMVCDDWEQVQMQPLEVAIVEAASDESPADEMGGEKSLVAYGGELKALGGGKVGGYLVRFTPQGDYDLTLERFAPETDYGDRDSVPVLYHHGLDAVVGKRILAKASLRRDDFGVWAETQLSLRDEYEKFIYQQTEAGKMGWSSGVPSHMIEKQNEGKGALIKMWHIAEASITPTPAEPRNTVVSLKSLQNIPLTANPEAEAKAAIPIVAPQATVTASDARTQVSTHAGKTAKEKDMDKAELDAALAPLTAKLEAIGTQVEAHTKALKAEPPINGNGGVNIQVEPSQKLPYKSVTTNGKHVDLTGLGEQLRDIAKAARGEGTSPRLVASQDLARKNIKAALGVNEEVGSEGGFLVQHDNAGWLAERSFSESQLADACQQLTVGAGANGIKLNDWDETSRADGSHYGGMAAYWLNEAGTYTASQPQFRQIDLQLGKLTALYYATDEEMEDAVGLSSRISVAYPRVMRWKIDNALLRGLGGAQPTGIIGHAYTVSVTKETGQAAATIVTANITKMYSRMLGFLRPGAAWYYNQDIEPQLLGLTIDVGTGGAPVFMPPNGLSAAPYGTIFGRPAIPLEQCATLGTVGDIIFANFSDYLLAKKGDVQQASSIHVQFLTGQQVFRFAQRVTGQPAYSTAVTPANGSNTLSAFITLNTRA